MMNTIPEVAVFDLGKVLVDFDYAIAARKLAAHCKLSAQQLTEFFGHSPLFLDYETGLMSNEEFFQKVCAKTGYGGPLEEFARMFADIFTAIEPMVRVLERLRASGFATYVFSNTNDLTIAHIRRHFPFFANFDGYVLSYQQRRMKPDPKLYELLEQLSGRRGAQILYLDDRLENTEAGKARGWQVIHHRSPEETIAELKRLGVMGNEC